MSEISYGDRSTAPFTINSTDEEPQNSESTIICRVCGSSIDTFKKRDQHVVKCEYCKEATVRIISLTSSSPYHDLKSHPDTNSLLST